MFTLSYKVVKLLRFLSKLSLAAARITQLIFCFIFGKDLPIKFLEGKY